MTAATTTTRGPAAAARCRRNPPHPAARWGSSRRGSRRAGSDLSPDRCLARRPFPGEFEFESWRLFAPARAGEVGAVGDDEDAGVYMEGEVERRFSRGFGWGTGKLVIFYGVDHVGTA